MCDTTGQHEEYTISILKWLFFASLDILLDELNKRFGDENNEYFVALAATDRQMTTFCLLNNLPFEQQGVSQTPHIPLDKAELKVAEHYVAFCLIGASTAEVQ